MGRYGKRDDLLVHEEEPFNAETGRAALAEGSLTATDAFYVRGHGAVPELDSAAWRLHVNGMVERELELSVSNLREAFRQHEVTATLQCAGNRRAGLMAIRDIPGEAPWGPGATGTAKWTGVALADVLALARPLSEAAHVAFEAADLCPDIYIHRHSKTRSKQIMKYQTLEFHGQSSIRHSENNERKILLKSE